MNLSSTSGVFAAGPTPGPPLPRQPSGVPWPTASWEVAEPDGDVDRSRLDAALADAFGDVDETGPGGGPYGMSLAAVIVHRGRLVAERYGPTAGPDEALISWSMAKSVTHALVGILVGQGRLSLHGRAAVPEWDDPADPRHGITLDQLLAMVPGTEFVEDYVDDTVSHCIEMLFGAGQHDMAAYTAALPAVAPPGTVFNYSSGTTNLICRILADVVGAGDAFDDFMHRMLLYRIGMTSARATFDGAGTWVGSSYLHATARDFAKFGLLYLRDGTWDGERVLPEGWVDHARTPRARDVEGAVYGAHWWIWEDVRGSFAAQGFETQRIVVDPAADLVVVRLGKTPAEQGPAVDSWLRGVIDCFPHAG